MTPFPLSLQLLWLLWLPIVALAVDYDLNNNNNSFNSNNNNNNNRLSLKNGRDSQCQGLWAKEGALQVGNACVQPDRENSQELMIDLSTTGMGWWLEDIQLWIGRDVKDIPVREVDINGDDDTTPKRISPSLEDFPHRQNNLRGEYSHFRIPVHISELPGFACPNPRGTQFMAVVHATVSARRSGLRPTGTPESGSATTTTQASAWASLDAPVAPLSNNRKSKSYDNVTSFNFTLVCDIIAERSHDAPERHHLNYVPS